MKKNNLEKTAEKMKNLYDEIDSYLFKKMNSNMNSFSKKFYEICWEVNYFIWKIVGKIFSIVFQK